jgi:hypothetical protein
MGARAPRHPIRNRRTSSLERQQNLSAEAEPVDEDNCLLLLAALGDVDSIFFSHLPL